MGLADFERYAHSPDHAVFHLERMSLLMGRLSNPHIEVPTVHIAGTKGKGSTAAMVTSILTAAGYTTGLYTSPHLHKAVERIRVGLKPIEPEEYVSLVERIWPDAAWVSGEGGYGGVTTFEFHTAMAFLHFQQINADFQVIEVGLGGRLDATNVVSPQVCAITTISLDHVAVLGDTLGQIAAEKAGIIKPNVPVVLAPQPREALEVFQQVAADKRAPLVQVGSEITWLNRNADLNGQSFEVSGVHGYYRAWLPLLGDFQVENACTAIATAEALSDRGFKVPSDAIIAGLQKVTWPGRLEILSHNGKTVVVDGAHNPASMRRLVRALRETFRFRRVILIFGSTNGHSARGMMTEVANMSPTVVAVRSRHPRSASCDTIASAARAQGLTIALESDDVGLATVRAIEMAGEDDLVLGTGSLFVAAEVIEMVRGISPELYPDIKGPTRVDGVVGRP
jgi:dihydrofolate synthase/folylpolyglutamate synthase